MYLITHIVTPGNTGSPDYNICSQASSPVGFENLKLNINLVRNGISYPLVATNDLSTYGIGNIGDYSFNDLIVTFQPLNINPNTGGIFLELDFKKLNNIDVKTWGKCYITFDVEVSEFQKFSNVFEIYGYDIGQTTGDDNSVLGQDLDTGIPFNINLVFDHFNIVNGVQTKAYSNLAILREPFTNNVYFYNMVGTQGDITYYNNSTLIGSGNHGLICTTQDITIKEKVLLSNGEYCEKELIDIAKIWLPKITVTSSCDTQCNDTINDISTVTAYETIDYTNVTPFYLNGTLVFLSQYFNTNVTFTLLDYTNNPVYSFTLNYVIDYTSWLSNPAPYLVPLEYDVVYPPLGDCTADIKTYFSDTSITTNYITITNTLSFNVCHWWSISKGTKCGDYIFNNCSENDIQVILQKLNDNKQFEDIAIIDISSNSNETISLQADGVFLIKVPSRTEEGSFEYYSIANYCAFEECWLNFLNKVICHKPKNECDCRENYEFNMFLINAHTFFMLLNNEFNYNFIYTSIDTTKIDSLYTINSFITRFNDYCKDKKCLPCSEK